LGAPHPHTTPLEASRRSWRALDWCVFFVADVQTGFGAFVAVFLTQQKWTQVDIGVLLTISGLVGLIAQAPCGALVDSVRSERRLAAVALVAIAGSAFTFAAWPMFVVAIASRVVLAVASCILGLAIVAISVGLSGKRGLARRLARNAAFASAGTGIAAALMGACGYYLSPRAVFYISGALAMPAIVALLRIRPEEIAPASDAGHGAPANLTTQLKNLVDLARQPGFAAFALCTMMFHLANAAMLPLAASLMTQRSDKTASLLVAAAIVIPQFTVSGLSLLVGRLADVWGRRPLLLIGFAALAMRGMLFALIREPDALVAIQALDGVSAAVLGVLAPLVIADVTRARHFNLAQGVIGCAMGVGASLSTTLSGYLADAYGGAFAFDALAMLAVLGLVLLALTMPETSPGNGST
jgi:MFS family permease